MNDRPSGLYRPEFEHDSCGFGLIAQMDGRTSNWLVRTAIESLARLTHRGAIGADGLTGDGCGILFKKPDAFLRRVADDSGVRLGELYATGIVFLGGEDRQAARERAALGAELQRAGLTDVAWREVPTDESVLGEEARAVLPSIRQVFVSAPAGMDEGEFDRRLFVARRRTMLALRGDETFYVCTLASRVIGYKGLMLPASLPAFYLDLQCDDVASDLCVFHQRFSTNTLPQWRLAQPFRMLAHNGEINTIQGNRHWAVARAPKFVTPLLPELPELCPLVGLSGSDSSSLDNMLEVLIAGGMDLFRAMNLLIPPAWQNVETMSQSLRAFHRYNSMHMEPWDGPAGIVLTDGRYAACMMDRNGLRPARYVITRDRHITLASESGVHEIDPAEVVARGRLRPGQMIAADTVRGQLLLPEDIEHQLASRQPYKAWLKAHQTRLHTRLDESETQDVSLNPGSLPVYQKMFGLTFEEREHILRPLADSGQEAVGSMGDDTPLPVMSRQVRSPYDYFRQQFAQVTNPPIDPLREQIVMALETCFGREMNPFEETPEHAARIVVDSPVLSANKLRRLLATDDPRYRHRRLDLNFDDAGNLRDAIGALCEAAVEAVREGITLLVLSDRDIARDRLPIHALLATGAVHHRLIAEGLRCDANLIVETATVRDPHHVAVLIGYGATAVYPYLACETLVEMVRRGEIPGGSNADAVLRSYRKGLNKGLFKIMSKMGISTIASYRGAQLFEAVGLHEEVVGLCMKGTVSRIQGTGFSDLEHDQRQLAAEAWNPRREIGIGGLLKYIHGGEYHAYHPEVVHALHRAVESGEYDAYRGYAQLINDREPMVLRDLLALREDIAPVDLDEVEPLERILPRFDSAGMSLGALSPEAHEALAIAMNRLGGRSNSGEGGEDPQRYGTERMSRIKQVASGRFGVTPEYLINAEVLQIKIAQGAKPGEGGQLPGRKVNELIARLRYSRPGVALISPPPHHDIYSIEDLAQLIFDLKQVNPDALVSVKLVAEAGVGTIAAGVAKAYADLITIAGYDGGTGASPLTSVKYAGGPWELGLSETQQTLRRNNLRGRVRLQADGGLKTGLDVIKAAILGAESFGFGTAPMIAMGCKYLRICHLNNCATGVATQDANLRHRHFVGTPERIANFFLFVARDTREWMARLGVRSIDELIGRTDLLRVIEGRSERQRRLDLSPILSDGGVPAERARFCQVERNRPFDTGELAERMVRDCLPAIERKAGGEFHYEIRNVHRTIGARLSGEIARRHGNLGMEDAPIRLSLRGHAGQSFGAFNAGGLHLYLEGDANDYVGKSMAGGKVVIRPPAGAGYRSQDAAIIGNTCLYGATGGRLFAAGRAGERFAVRNSGAVAVVEGAGDHGCEYMTGGVVTVLGSTGLNFGAGMTGGLAFVLDRERNFVDCYNHELIDIHRLTPESMEAHLGYLREILTEYVAETGSEWGRTVIDDLMDLIGMFWLVKPKAADLEGLLETLMQAA